MISDRRWASLCAFDRVCICAKDLVEMAIVVSVTPARGVDEVKKMEWSSGRLELEKLERPLCETGQCGGFLRGGSPNVKCVRACGGRLSTDVIVEDLLE